MVLNTFVLVGTILSYDPVFVTVEFNTNPAVNGGPSTAILPVSAIPCEVSIGDTIYVVKNTSEKHAHISCKKDGQEN